MRLETSRLTIDHLRSGDLVDLHRMDTDLSVRRYIDGQASSLEKTKQYLSENIISYRENGYGIGFDTKKCRRFSIVLRSGFNDFSNGEQCVTRYMLFA